MTNTGNAIEVSDLSFAYGDIQAVDGVSFSVAPGEILGFLGPNGAGKSTTIKMLTGQLRPDSGSISVLGMTMPAQTLDIQARIGVCFEEKNLYENMSGRENLDFFARLYGIKGRDFDPFLRKVGLIDRADDRVASYSKGMRQRLMMTRAMINDPDILFLDEPTDGLDPVSSQAVRNVIKAEAERGAAVILTTHDMHEADQLSDRVAFINEGRIAALDTSDNLKLEYGQRTVRIRSRNGGDVDVRVISLDESSAGDQIREAVAVEGLMTIHTEEATLEDIFIKLTGRGLDA
ncbi:MAG: ABC transporter ATP-binding protein [Acidimicrobiia bacterium]|nr:ABC transporter ATP-binding protein [Acidimicrobiia bacterium]